MSKDQYRVPYQNGWATHQSQMKVADIAHNIDRYGNNPYSPSG